MDFKRASQDQQSAHKAVYCQNSGLVYTGSYNYKARTSTIDVITTVPSAQAFVASQDQGRNQQQYTGYQAPTNVPAYKPTDQMASIQSNAQGPVPVDNEAQNDQSRKRSSAVSEPRVFLDMDTGKQVRESKVAAARTGAASDAGVLAGKPDFDLNKHNPYNQLNYQPMQPAKRQKANVDATSITKNSAMASKATTPNAYGNQPNYHQTQPPKQQKMQGYPQQNGSQGVATIAPGDPAVQQAAADNRGQYQSVNARPGHQNIPPQSAIPRDNRPYNAQFGYQNGMNGIRPSLPYPALPGQFGQGNSLMQTNLPYPAYNHGGHPQIPLQQDQANRGGRYDGRNGPQQPQYHHLTGNHQNALQQPVGHGGNQLLQTGNQQRDYSQYQDPASSFRYASNYAREAYAQEQRRREAEAQERRRAAAANRAAERNSVKEEASTSKKRKQRITLTDQQRSYLEQFYFRCKYPLSDQVESLSYNTRLSFKELKTWFKNRRSKDRRDGVPIRR